MVRDLLALAARALRPGGRLVYWLPASGRAAAAATGAGAGAGAGAGTDVTDATEGEGGAGAGGVASGGGGGGDDGQGQGRGRDQLQLLPQLPEHADLELVDCGGEPLARKCGRRLITMMRKH